MAFQGYKNRVNRNGGTSLKDHVKQDVRRNLDKFLNISQYGFDVLIDGKTERIGIMTSKMSDSYDGVYVLSRPGVLQMGTLFEWDGDFWVVLKRTVRVIKESFYGEAYRCNIELKWVDKDGNLKTQKGYGKGRGFSALLVEKNRTEPPLLMREAELPLTVATERNLEFKQDMRFIFNGIPYRTTSVDNLSIDGMTILGMYDDIIEEGDDLVNNIANYKGKYKIELDFESPVTIIAGNPFKVDYHLVGDGLIIENKDVIIDVDSSKARVNDDNSITPLVLGDIFVTVKAKQNPTIETSFTLKVSAEEDIQENIYIVGRDEIEWDSSELYKLNTDEDAEFEVTFPKKVKGTAETTHNSVLISIKDKYSGTVKLKVTQKVVDEDGNELDPIVYTKDINIVTNLGGDRQWPKYSL